MAEITGELRRGIDPNDIAGAEKLMNDAADMINMLRATWAEAEAERDRYHEMWESNAKATAAMANRALTAEEALSARPASAVIVCDAEGCAIRGIELTLARPTSAGVGEEAAKVIQELLREVEQSDQIVHARYDRATKTYPWNDDIWKKGRPSTFALVERARALLSPARAGSKPAQTAAMETTSNQENENG